MKRMMLILLCAVLLVSCGHKPVETQPERISATIYSGNKNADGFVTTQVQLEKLNPITLTDQLIQIGVLTEDVEILALSQRGGQLFLDFSSSFATLICSQGTAGEYIIMGSVVNTFLDAYGTETVTITVNGQVLESGHVIYDFPMARFE